MKELKCEYEKHRNDALNKLSDPGAVGGQQPSLGRKSRRLLRWREMSNLSEAQQTDDAFQELKAITYLFIALTELFDNRPVPFWLPLCLCVFRYKSTEFVQESIVSDFEFEQVLNTYGYTDEEVQLIDAIANSPLAQIEGYENHPLASQGGRVRDLPVDEFVRFLSEKLRLSASTKDYISNHQINQGMKRASNRKTSRLDNSKTEFGYSKNASYGRLSQP
jgi:hypothetical protein